MDGLKEMVTDVVEKLTEDKLMAMICLTLLGVTTVHAYPIQESLPVITGVVSGIAGFVTGSVKK